MKVTKRWCSNCEGEGDLVNVVKRNGETDSGWPAIGAREDLRHDNADDRDPDDYDVVSLSDSYPCKNCGGSGFFFYIEEEGRSGETILLEQLPKDAELVEVSGPELWVARHKRQQANFIWKGKD